MNKQVAVNMLRYMRLLPTAERTRFIWSVVRFWTANRDFLHDMDGFVPPPAWIMYDAFGHVNYRAYHNTGKTAANAIAAMILPYLNSRTEARILEWGCGPARIVQHIPSAFAAVRPAVYATDYNSGTIKWCQNAIHNIHFEENGLRPPLPFEDASFDFVYCASVFTHLSEDSHHEWLKELRRVLIPGGALMLTTHGDKCRPILLPVEQVAYDQGRLVVRGAVKEGSRIYSTFHSPAFMEKFLGKSNLVLHEPNPDPSISGGQDVWVTR